MSIPYTEKMKPRPVYNRYLMRKHSMDLAPPSEEEKWDAIRVLAEPYMYMEYVALEAFKILDEGGR